MAQPVTVFRWDDAGAPQLVEGKPSEIIDILTKCLVDGYGDKLPLGWTRPFYDATNQAAAFRNNVAAGGSGGFVKFYSDNNSDANNATMRLTSAASMVGMNTLFNQGNIHSFTAVAGSGSNKMDKWAVIGTSTAFYMFISRNNQPIKNINSYNPTFFAGDFFSVLPNDAGRFIAFSTLDTNGDVISTSFVNSLDRSSLIGAATGSPFSNSPLKIYDADGFNSARNYAGFHQLAQCSSSDAAYNSPPAYAPTLTPMLIWYTGQYASYTDIKDRLGELLQNSVVSPLFRGILPGIFVNAYAGWMADAWPKIVNIGSEDHWLLRNSSGPGRIFVNMEAWHDPFNAL